jgi:hypothetical protein
MAAAHWMSPLTQHSYALCASDDYSSCVYPKHVLYVNTDNTCCNLSTAGLHVWCSHHCWMLQVLQGSMSYVKHYWLEYSLKLALGHSRCTTDASWRCVSMAAYWNTLHMHMLSDAWLFKGMLVMHINGFISIEHCTAWRHTVADHCVLANLRWLKRLQQARTLRTLVHARYCYMSFTQTDYMTCSRHWWSY